MKVKDLIKKLQKMPQEAIVVCHRDSSENGHSPLDDVESDYVYKEENSYRGTAYSKDWEAEDADLEEEEWEDLKEKSPDCIVLYSVH